MPSRRLFLLSLTAFVLLHLCYGLKRATLGIDLTDEGAHISWPMRMLFGERLFASEPAILLRPLIGCLSFLYKLHPTITLYEFRMLGWCIHLVAFVTLSIFLYRLSGAPLQSPLIASIPLYVCNILGLVSPSYYTLSSDFLLIALNLLGIAALDKTYFKALLQVAGGAALFIATMAHPALGLVAAIILGRESLANKLIPNLWRRQLSPSNIGVLTFVTCWLAFLTYVVWSGGHSDWIQRVTLFRSFTVSPINRNPANILLLLVLYPFCYSRMAILFTLASAGSALAFHVFNRTKQIEYGGGAALTLALLLLTSLICTFSYQSNYLPICFAMVSLILVGTHCLGPWISRLPVDPNVKFLIAISAIASLVCAAATYYFSPHRSWISGTLALPFAFGVGLTLLMNNRTRKPGAFQILPNAALIIAVICAAREHYREIYRDASPDELRASFEIPKLYRIKSTSERVSTLESLYQHLQPKLRHGETLLAFDHCPILYYLFDAMPAYGLTWAARYTQSQASLQALDREFRAKPLPRYAIRALVDVSNVTWKNSPTLSYENYPLNDTLLANYELDRTISPFEVWRLKSVRP